MLNHDLVLKHNELYLVGESQSDGSGERATGLYVRDTRFLTTGICASTGRRWSRWTLASWTGSGGGRRGERRPCG